MSFWKRLFGKESVDPDIQRAVDEQLQDFVRENFVELYAHLRWEKNFSEEEARDAMVQTLALQFVPSVRKAAIDYIAAGARLRLPEGKWAADDTELDRALHKSAKASFRSERVAQLAVREIYSQRLKEDTRAQP